MVKQIGDYVIVEKIQEDSKFVLPDSASKLYKVVSVPVDEWYDDIKIGEIVYVNEVTARIKDGDKEYVVVRYDEIIAKKD